MPDDIAKKMDIVAELRIRQYFDHFLEEILPTILENHEKTCPYGRQVSRLKWSLIGAATTLVILVPTIGKPLWALIVKL